MEHEQAAATLAAERYLLNELTAAEREAFEEHYFVCKRCAQEVKDLYALGAGARADHRDALRQPAIESVASRQRTRRWERFVSAWTFPRFAVAVPSVVLVAAVVTGWQVIQMRSLTQPREIASLVLHPETRGETAAVSARRLGPYLLLECDLPGSSGSVTWTLTRAPSTEVLHEGRAAAPEAGSSFKLLFPSSSFAPGDYTLNIQPAANNQAMAGARSWTYRFKIK
jgi:hypothetical protein